MSSQYRYYAFISYSPEDRQWATWLHRALQGYRLPKQLVGQPSEVGPIPPRLSTVFGPRNDHLRRTDSGDSLVRALEESAAQIVICSPAAAHSRSVNEEILAFKRLGREHRVFCIVVDGEPGASLRPEIADQECFPKALRFRMGSDGQLTDELSEPIAADARPGKDRRQDAMLKLMAGVLGIGFDALKQREAHRRQRRMVAFSSAAVTGLIITSGLAAAAWFAKIDAERQRKRAVAEAETARQTSQFLLDLFKVPNPSEAVGNSITAREILDRGAQRIDTELGDQPEIRATLMDTMGTVYTGLGLYDPAAQLLDKSLETRRRLLDGQHPQLAATIEHLGQVLGRKGDFVQAQTLYEEALRIRQARGETLETARSLTGIAEMLLEKGDYDRADPLYEEALAIRRGAPGDNRAELAESLRALGSLEVKQGRYSEAVEHMREAVELRRRLHGKAHPELAATINDLGWALVELQELEESERLFREALDMRRALLGERHPEVALATNNVGYVLETQGDLPGAERMYRQAIAVQRTAVGESHPLLASYMSNLAFVLYLQGNVSEAIALLQEAGDLRRRLLGVDHPEVADADAMLAYWYIQQEEYVKADELLDEALTIRRNSLGDKHPDVANTLTLKATTLVATGRYEEGLDAAQTARRILTASLPPDHWRVAAAASVEGSALAALRQYRDAEIILLESDSILQNAPMPGLADMSRQRLAGLYRSWGKPQQAARYASDD